MVQAAAVCAVVTTQPEAVKVVPKPVPTKAPDAGEPVKTPPPLDLKLDR
jgi:hypothetical protein